jgi:hypothetical protein
MSRFKMFILKFIPRVLVLAALIVILAIFYKVTFYGVIVPLFYFQLGMMFLSLAFTRSYFAGFICAILLGFFFTLGDRLVNVAYYYLGWRYHKIFDYFNPRLTFTLLFLVPLAISFYLVLKNFDLKPYKYTIRPYFYVAVPVIALEMALMIALYGQYSRLF